MVSSNIKSGVTIFGVSGSLSDISTGKWYTKVYTGYQVCTTWDTYSGGSYSLYNSSTGVVQLTSSTSRFYLPDVCKTSMVRS